ncbi:unnamed protein product [Peniophora sp. CBMAI 1063]|nr:unnamed protein product [Peniophora sp. CBMAI 1063]
MKHHPSERPTPIPHVRHEDNNYHTLPPHPRLIEARRLYSSMPIVESGQYVAGRSEATLASMICVHIPSNRLPLTVGKGLQPTIPTAGLFMSPSPLSDSFIAFA